MDKFDLTEYVYRFSYLGVFLWFAVLEQLTPVPEEAFLISLGYISIHAGLNPFLCGIVAIAGLLSCDFFLYFISLKGYKLAQNMMKKVSSKVLDKIKKNLKENPVKTLFVMALIPKIRFLSPIVAGITGISWRVFLLVNSIATAFYVCVYVSIGILFHKGLGRLMKKLEWTQHIIFIATIAIVAIFIVLKIRKAVQDGKNEDPLKS